MKNKMKNIIMFIIGMLIGHLIITIEHYTEPKVDLPEEYKLITKDTPIRGHFEGETLVIEFVH